MYVVDRNLNGRRVVSEVGECRVGLRVARGQECFSRACQGLLSLRVLAFTRSLEG